jgi:hypothetical protein
VIALLAAAATTLPVPKLYPLPASGVRSCQTLQRRVDFTVLCPARLPRATRALPWRPTWDKPRFRVDFVGDTFHPKRPGPIGLDLGYGVPVEPFPGDRGWPRRHFWLNRPAYFLHFTIYRRGLERVPPPLYRRCFGRRCGAVRYAEGYGLRPGPYGFYWANHTWFFWRERGIRWAASLHYFGRGATTSLLGRILQELRPAARLPG